MYHCYKLVIIVNILILLMHNLEQNCVVGNWRYVGICLIIDYFGVPVINYAGDRVEGGGTYCLPRRVPISHVSHDQSVF